VIDVSIFNYLDEFPWKDAVNDKFNRLLNLKKGWDGHKGEPVDPGNAFRALEILRAVCDEKTPRPFVFPGVLGDVRMEWSGVSVDVSCPRTVRLWTDDPSVCPGDEPVFIGSDLAPIRKAIRGRA
jgi:hypothetical protein